MSDLSATNVKKTARRSWLAAATNDTDFVVTALFCAVGLWVSINVLHHFPSLVTAISQLN